MSNPSPTQAAIYLPLERLDKCSVCGTSGVKLQLCSSCGEAVYCSQACQRSDWKAHKPHCGTTDRIDFGSYYPYIAGTIEAFRMMQAEPDHPAICNKIVNSPNPGDSELTTLPNGVGVKLVLLGDALDSKAEISSPKWWPSAQSPQVRSKFFRRILREGNVLAHVLAATMGLVAGMYSTTALPAGCPPRYQVSGRRRVRLTYMSSPIADIGVAKGSSLPVTSQDRLAYYNLNTNEFFMGQDPNDHYWIYFTTLNGEEYILDCGMFTFNFTMIVNTSSYRKFALPPIDWAPALFFTREMRQSLPLLGGSKKGYQTKERFTILRNSSLHPLLADLGADEKCTEANRKTLASFMDKVSGRECHPSEHELLVTFYQTALRVFKINIQEREYLNFPKEPLISFDLDPDETLNDGTEEQDREFGKILKKWTKKLKHGKVSAEEWDAAFTKWAVKPHGPRRKATARAIRAK